MNKRADKENYAGKLLSIAIGLITAILAFVYFGSTLSKLIPGIIPLSDEVSSATPSRKFTGPGQYPPENFLAYGILAFPQRATPDSRQRHLMICDAYVSALPHSTELKGIPLSEQMVTVWPIENDELAARIDIYTPRNEVCEIAVDHYGLVVAKSALNDVANVEAIEKELIRGDSIDFKNLTQGPYLLAWAPGNKKGDSDALVLVVDLTRVNLPQHAEAIFSRWIREIEKNPSLWSNGWDIPAVRLRLRLWADDIGDSVVGGF